MREKLDKQSIISHFTSIHNLPESFSDTANIHFWPLIESIAGQLQKNIQKQLIPFVLGINGCQGSGKSTLADFIVYALSEGFQFSSVAMSIDDFYLTKAERSTMAETVHPLFSTRGVPGTHDTKLLLKTLENLMVFKNPVRIPSFDKSTDDRKPISEWPTVINKVDLILLEGWCVGSTAQSPAMLVRPINTLEEKEDAAAVWRTHSNNLLSITYHDVFQLIDRMVFLKAPGFQTVLRWRNEQELRLKEQYQKGLQFQRPYLEGSVIELPPLNVNFMTESQIERFIQHYQRITENTLSTLTEQADDVFQLDNNREIVQSVIMQST